MRHFKRLLAAVLTVQTASSVQQYREGTDAVLQTVLARTQHAGQEQHEDQRKFPPQALEHGPGLLPVLMDSQLFHHPVRVRMVPGLIFYVIREPPILLEPQLFV